MKLSSMTISALYFVCMIVWAIGFSFELKDYDKKPKEERTKRDLIVMMLYAANTFLYCFLFLAYAM